MQYLTLISNTTDLNLSANSSVIALPIFFFKESVFDDKFLAISVGFIPMLYRFEVIRSLTDWRYTCHDWGVVIHFNVYLINRLCEIWWQYYDLRKIIKKTISSARSRYWIVWTSKKSKFFSVLYMINITWYIWKNLSRNLSVKVVTCISSLKYPAIHYPPQLYHRQLIHV